MRADPVPEGARLDVRAERAMMCADANGSVHADVLEMQRRMSRIVFQEVEVLVRNRLDRGRQRFVAPPKCGGGAMV